MLESSLIEHRRISSTTSRKVGPHRTGKISGHCSNLSWGRKPLPNLVGNSPPLRNWQSPSTGMPYLSAGRPSLLLLTSSKPQSASSSNTPPNSFGQQTSLKLLTTEMSLRSPSWAAPMSGNRPSSMRCSITPPWPVPLQSLAIPAS